MRPRNDKGGISDGLNINTLEALQRVGSGAARKVSKRVVEYLSLRCVVLVSLWPKWRRRQSFGEQGGTCLAVLRNDLSNYATTSS